jgi:hypothetical protein
LILLDFSQTTIVTLMGHLKHDKEAPITMSLCRNLWLRNILELRKKFHKRFGEIVICVDGNDYWRRSIFPFYKGARKKSKEESVYDWKQIKYCQNTVQEELTRFFPYSVISTPCAEADDIIAIMAKWSQTNDLNDGVFESPKDSVIVSADGDFLQLQKYKNIKQFSPMTWKQVTLETKLDQFCLEHILCGDGTDSIPSFLSPLDFFRLKEESSTPMRQKPVTAAIKTFYYDQILEHGSIINFRSESEKLRFYENERLVMFDHIPESIEKSVLESFHSQQGKNRKNVLNYLAAAKLTNLIENVTEF